ARPSNRLEGKRWHARAPLSPPLGCSDPTRFGREPAGGQAPNDDGEEFTLGRRHRSNWGRAEAGRSAGDQNRPLMRRRELPLSHTAHSYVRGQEVNEDRATGILASAPKG